jgi:excisionase family DNA binding protein
LLVKLERKVLTVKEVADYLGLHASTVYRMLKHGDLPGWKIRSNWYFNIEDIEEFRKLHGNVPKLP